MALSAFDDSAAPPSARSLEDMLGRSYRLWSELKAALEADHGPLSEEWNYSGKAYGWSMRLKRPKRTVVYLTPCRAHFLAGFALGEKAVQAARVSRLPASIANAIEDAPKYAEGRGVRIAIRTKADMLAVRKLAAIKLAH